MQYHILSGSFRSSSLFLLSFSPTRPGNSSPATISHISTISANGPHQYIAHHRNQQYTGSGNGSEGPSSSSSSGSSSWIYTTSWALPPSLAAWRVDLTATGKSVDLIGEVPITATSSYISIPPPYTYVYSMGGPTGEVHVLDQETGAFGKKIQEVLFVKEDELAGADKTRKALRYGSHAIEVSSRGLAFAPVLGSNSIEVYTVPSSVGIASQDFNGDQQEASHSRGDDYDPMRHIASIKSPREHDGPRHLVVHPSGERLYVVTEHTNYLDIYRITRSPSTPLIHLQSASLLPLSLRSSPSAAGASTYRGDTLRLHPSTPSHPSPSHIFTTTRGAEPHTKGWLSVFALDKNGDLLYTPETPDPAHDGESGKELGVERWETPTSGGKANAIDLRVKSSSPREQEGQSDSLEFDTRPPQAQMHLPGRGRRGVPVVPPPDDFEPPANDSHLSSGSTQEEEDGLWILLTDDCGGISEEDEKKLGCGPGVRVLDWSKKDGVKGIVAEWPNSASDTQLDEQEAIGGDRLANDQNLMRGGSHAVWLD